MRLKGEAGTRAATRAPALVPRPEPAVSVRDVCVDFGRHRVLDSVSLDVDHGEFVGIVGPNGGGKSTLLRTVLGLQPHTCGEVRLFGTPLKRFHGHNRIGYVPQNAVHVDARFPATAFEVALLGRVGRRGLFRRVTAEDRRITLQALEDVGVANLANQLVGTLSGGQRQRVFLAKALAAEPDLLILDEPTTGVDPRAREGFYDLLDRLNHERGLTLVLVSHDTQAIALSTHRLVAVNRVISYDGDPKAFEESGGYAAAYDFKLHHHPEDEHRD